VAQEVHWQRTRRCDQRRDKAENLTEELAMLVLSRKLGQRFQVGQDVRITIVKIDRNSVRIGIEAPGEVTVYREEIIPTEPEERMNANAA
jgi:carbon storage regulator